MSELNRESPTEEESWHEKFLNTISLGMTKGIDLAIGNDLSGIVEFVDLQRSQHPELIDKPFDLARRIIGKRQWYAGAISFFYGLGGIITFLPNLVHVWRIHGRLVLTVAYIFGYDPHSPERREEIALCFALSSGNEAIKKVLKESGMIGAKKVLLTEGMKEIIKQLPRRIVTIAGEKSLLNVAKVLPIFGGVVCGVMDFFSTKGVGEGAISFYS